MPTPISPKPIKPLVYTAALSIFLTIVTIAIILKATDQVLELRQPSANADTYAVEPSRDASGAPMPMMAVGMPAPVEMMAGSSESMMYGKSVMPIMPPPGTGATPEDRARVGAKIIRNGSLTIRVDDAAKRLEDAKLIAEQMGGFVSSANLVDQGGVKTAYLTLRVPTETYRATTDAIKKLASTIFNESETGQDVTDQYVDLEARLNAAKAEEVQYLDILKSARSIEDTLNVTARLADVRSRIEILEGQTRQLTDQTSYATLQVTMTEETRVEAPTRVWKPSETLRLAIRALVESFQKLVDLTIAFVVFFIGLILPVLLVLALVAWLSRAIIRRLLGK